MSGVLETRKLWITPLSPVHMGTDQDYVPTNYVIEGDALYEFDDRALENLPDSERRALNNLLDGKARPEMLKNVQAFFHRNRECLIPAAVNVIRVSHEMAALYEGRVGKAANIESSGKQILNALEIQRAFHNPIDRRLILPGSGLKGAMRTALLDKINDGRPSQGKEKNRELQQRLFQYTLPELHKDPLRLLQVGDCAWRGPDAINSAEVLFAVNRKKRPVRENGQELLSRAEQQNLYQLLECAAPFRFRAFQGWLNIMQTKGAGRQTDRLPALRFSFAELASACNRFYRPIFDCEIELLRKRGMLDTQWREIVEAWLGNENIQRRLRDNNAFLLRAGRHSGAESVTLNGVRSIRIMKGKGQEPAFEPAAKTIWLATGDKNDRGRLRPFGWLLVEMTEPDERLPPWPEAEELMQQQRQAMSAWLSEIAHRQASLRARIDERRALAERRAREDAEREAKARAEQQRLANMSGEERQIEELRKLLEADRKANRKEPGGVLNEKRLELLQAATGWEDPRLRKQAAELLRETAKHLPWAKKRKKQIQQQLTDLEGEA